VWVGVAARGGRVGVDVIALAALLGAIAVDELFAGAVITVMLTTGRALEGWAAGRAERELHALLEHRPLVAHRYEGGELVERSLESIVVGDILLVQPGEVVPVDGTVHTGVAVLDESALTGEALPVQRSVGDAVRSGGVNAGGPSTSSRRPRPPTPRSPESCDSWRRPPPPRRRSSASPTATPPRSWWSRSRSRLRRGWSPAMPRALWPYWWSPRPAP
jgi:magnesium-transporting ATPase (P-type)